MGLGWWSVSRGLSLHQLIVTRVVTTKSNRGSGSIGNESVWVRWLATAKHELNGLRVNTQPQCSSPHKLAVTERAICMTMCHDTKGIQAFPPVHWTIHCLVDADSSRASLRR